MGVVGPLVGFGLSAPWCLTRHLLRPPGSCHVPWSAQPVAWKVGDRGVRPRRSSIHLLRDLPVSPPDAGPLVDEPVRRRSDGPVPLVGVDDDGAVQLADAVAAPHRHPGRAVLGRAEAASFGVLVATIMGGSVVLYLAASPFVYNEDFAWSIPLTLGSLFALLGVMERPSTGRVWASGILILLANLNRTPTGYACVIGAVLVAGWFGLGRGGASNRRWVWPMLAVALVGFGASGIVTYAKFGTPVGLPMADQVWASVNAHRRYFLAANGGKAFSVGFLPSTAVAYLQPFGIRFSSLFPFVSTPAAPARAIGAVLDQTYPTASLPPTMPLLFLLACWGTITAFRPRGLVPFRLTRIVLVAGAAGTAGVLLVGLYLRAVPGRLHALPHRGRWGRSHRGVATPRRSVPKSQRACPGHPLCSCRLLRRGQYGHRGDTYGCVHADADPELRVHPGFPQRRVIGRQCAAWEHPPGLGSVRTALHGRQLFGPLSGVRHLRSGRARRSHRPLHVASRRTGSRLHPPDLVHLQLLDTSPGR